MRFESVVILVETIWKIAWETKQGRRQGKYKHSHQQTRDIIC